VLLEARDGVFVCHRDGHRSDFRKVWATACTKAGADGRLVHDLRRTAAHEYRRAGLSDGKIMKLCGWDTQRWRSGSARTIQLRDRNTLPRSPSRS
jgi:integrase